MGYKSNELEINGSPQTLEMDNSVNLIFRKVKPRQDLSCENFYKGLEPLGSHLQQYEMDILHYPELSKPILLLGNTVAST